MIAARYLFDEIELTKWRRAIVYFWSSSAGISDHEIARRLNISVSGLRYIFAHELDDGPCFDVDAIIALYHRALAGDQEAAIVYLAAASWARRPFAEILAMPGRVALS